MMRTILFLLGVIFSGQILAHSSRSSTLEYIENNGQWEQEVRYKADLQGGWVFLGNDALTYLFFEEKLFKHGHRTNAGKQTATSPSGVAPLDIIKGHAYRTTWVGANKVVPVAAKPFSHYYNYFTDSDKAKWKSGVKAWQVVEYPELYPNINLQLYSDGPNMKSDYIVKAGGNPAQIKVVYEGVDKLFLQKDGSLYIQTSVNHIEEFAPYAYQVIDGNKVQVNCQYSLKGNQLGFTFPDGYQKEFDLVIDPVLNFSTYSGSNSDNWGSSATNDKNGNMFLGGISLGAAFPTTLGAFQTVYGGGSGSLTCDVAITKISNNGSTRLYSTYLGGNSNEILTSLFCTDQNELVALVTTSSLNFPTTSNAFRRQFSGGTSTSAFQGSIAFPNGTDIAVVKFNTSGSALIGSTFFGGSGNDGINNASGLLFNYGDESRSEVVVDPQGNIYVASVTNSTNIPVTANALQSTLRGSSDGLIFKMNAALSSLTWATYYGGSQADGAYALALDPANNNIFICGGTRSSDLPGTSNGLNTTYRGGTTDGYMAKLNSSGTSLLSATYMGTDAYDQTYLIDFDNLGNIVAFGQTLGDYPVSAGVYNNPGSKQFLHKLNNNLNSTIFSTTFGRENYTLVNISPTALLVDVCGNIYAVGWGGGVNFDFQLDAGNTAGMPTTPDAFKPTTDNSDFYLISLSNDAKQLIYGSYFGEQGSPFSFTGEDHVDGGTSRFDKNGVVYQAICASCGGTDGFPTTPGAISATNNSSNCNMAGVKFSFDLLALQVVEAKATPSVGCSPLNTSFTYTSTRPGTSFFWDFGDGTTSTEEFPTHTYSQPGTYNVKFIIRNPQDCNPQDSTTITVRVSEPITSNVSQTICSGQSITVGDQTFDKTGTYTVTITNSSGCDSIVTLNLTVADSILTDISKDICRGETFQVGSQTFNESGNYTVNLQTSGGCDSIVQLSLNVIDSIVTDIQSFLCEGQTITVGGQVFSETGFYSIPLQSVIGCDSIVNLNLLISDQFVTDLDVSICQGETYSYGNQTFDTSGTYQLTFPGVNCDTIVNIRLTVQPNPSVNATADSTLVPSGTIVTLSAQTQAVVTYQWQPSEQVTNPTSATTSVTVFEPTIFYVTVTDVNGCSSTDSVLINILEEDCADENVFIPSAFTPNGDGKNDVLFVRSSIPLTSMRLIVYNRWGEQVFESVDQTIGWNGTFRDKDAQAGVYGFFFEGQCGEIIIERKGNITLIR
jgi:gliding motility-associated-like protein